jgi:hypothetical protein
MKSCKHAAIAFCCGFLCAIGAAKSFAQGIIVNGGFESPAIPSDTTQDVDPANWSRIDSNGTITHLFNGNGGISGVPMPHSGNQQFLLGFLGTGIFQNVMITGWNRFRLDWWTATDVSESSIVMTYNVRIWNNADSSLIIANQYEARLGAAWETAGTEISLQPGSYRVEFRTTDFFNNGGIFLDDVSMVPIPEPNTFALFGFGILGLIGMQFDLRMRPLTVRTQRD